MLTYNEVLPKTVIVYNDEPYEVLVSDIAKRTKQKPVNQTKLRNLVTGAVVNVAFRQSDKLEEAELEKKELKYLYRKGAEVWFSDPEDPSNRISLTEEEIGDVLKFTRQNENVTALLFDEKIITLTAPIKVILEVSEAPPNIRGNTSSGGTKQVTLETGFIVTTPLFIETGDKIEINTQTGEYVTRVEKS